MKNWVCNSCTNKKTFIVDVITIRRFLIADVVLRTSLLYKSLALNKEYIHIILVKDKVKHKGSQAFVSTLNFDISIEGSNIANGNATSVATTIKELSRILYCPSTLS